LSTRVRFLLYPCPSRDGGLVEYEAIREVVVDIVHERCAALDISKRDAKVCVRVPGKRRGTFTSEVTTWGATTNQVLALREFLLAAEVTAVVIEATGDYWKPFYYLLEDSLNVLLVNARHVKNLPGRKTDVSDAQWLAQLGAHGLVRGSLVPPEPVRNLRDLTRTRTRFIRERAREVQRLEKLLEDAGIKLSAVASDITGVSGRAMLEALIAGQDDPAVLADLAKRRMRSKIPELIEALTGRFREHHGFLARLHLDHIDRLTASIDALAERISQMITPFQREVELLATIPGIARHNAEVIVAEIGGHIDCFPSAAHLASWAGVAPGQHESAGKKKPVRTRPGNSYLKGALGIAAFAAAHSNGTYLQARYRRLSARRGPMRALVAIEHSLLTAIWHMLTTTSPYQELGGDFYTRLDPERAKNRIVRQANALGLTVRFEPIETFAT
jgi:transposase